MELKVIHTGQYHAYGDTHREYEIHMTNEEICTTSIDEILKLCDNGSKLPKDEWQARTGNIDDYFKGYYTLMSTDFGYVYHGVEPYTD